ncbi:unnamed protein product [Symbiodinium necroappetens]|uniref:Uncharacterized protein n=1 Tax=Symbiodinium necroappetens TaxID=1628268 RepID=A0A812S6K8_9DINO|nr:unnamed protein product [Symbiodinium necroappetens]
MTLSKLLEEVAFKTGRRGCDEAGIIGSWEGTVSESLGGYHQHIVFEEGGRARVTVGQQTFMANYTMNCLSLPMTLDLELPSAIIPYIFKLEKGCLHLCGAGCGRGRPKSFHGPGLCIMNRADSFDGLQRGPELEQPGISHFASSPPELSGKKAFGVPAVLKFMENQPALMASAMMAAVGAVVAWRKS